MKFKFSLNKNVLATVLGAAAILSAGQMASASCGIFKSVIPGEIMIGVNTSQGTMYPSYQSVLEMIQDDPSLFPSLNSKNPEHAIHLHSYVVGFPLYDESGHIVKDEQGREKTVSGLTEHRIRYVPEPEPSTRQYTDGLHYPISGFSSQLIRQHQPDGVNRACYISAKNTLANRALLKNYIAALPECIDEDTAPDTDGPASTGPVNPITADHIPVRAARGGQ